MRINHNISALNAWRNITMVNSTMSKTLERLSSGLRINRAGDDAAGLAISEKMRGQIKGLEMAIKNSQDAISLIQTAEGALTEVHSILQRMRELAVQAASDTNTDVDRNQIQAELDQLKDEIDRIARTTEFNSKKLLDGKLEGFRNTADVKVVTGGNLNVNADLGAAGVASGYTLAQSATSIGEGNSLTINIAGTTFTITLTANDTIQIVGSGVTIGNVGAASGTVSGTFGDVKFTFTLYTTGASVYKLTNTVVTAATTVSAATVTDVQEGTYVVEVGQFTGGATSGLDTRVLLFNENGLATTITANFTAGQIYTANGSLSVASVSSGNIDLTATASAGLRITWDTTVYDLNDFGGALPSEEVVDSGVIRAEARNEGNTQLIFQIGSNEGHNMIAGIDDMSAKALGITDDSLDVTNQNVAERTIMVIDGAIHKVSSQRALLGAVQNRLEHTISNLGVAEENLTAAESRIRDADMAKEMMQFTKQQILLQSANAMLAQANALPQNVLQLLR